MDSCWMRRLELQTSKVGLCHRIALHTTLIANMRLFAKLAFALGYADYLVNLFSQTTRYYRTFGADVR